MRAFRITRGWTAAFLALFLGILACSFSIGSFFPVLERFAAMPGEMLVVSALLAGTAAMMESRDWTYGSYITIGACLGMMVSVVVGAWSISEAALTGEYGLLIVVGFTTYGVILGALSLAAYRLAAGNPAISSDK